MKNNEYTPIPCSYYDKLEAIATQKKKVNIQYLEKDEVKSAVGIIADFIIENKVEYLVLATRQKVRLDRLVEVDGNKLSDFNFC